MSSKAFFAAVVCTGIVSGAGRAGIAYQSQDRVISAATSADGNFQSVSAPDFGRFQETITLATDFVGADGTQQLNEATAGIDCQLDPNAILVNGSLSGAGGLELTGGQAVTGEAAVSLAVEFVLGEASEFSLRASARPSANDHDRFKVKLENLNGTIFFIDESDPAQAVDVGGVLAAGTYVLEYQAELTIDGPETLRDYFFNLTIPGPGTVMVVPAAALGIARRRRAASGR